MSDLFAWSDSKSIQPRRVVPAGHSCLCFCVTEEGDADFLPSDVEKDILTFFGEMGSELESGTGR